MKALSIKQPWASLIVLGYKDIENRTWPLPSYMKGQRIYIHASSTPDRISNVDLLRLREILSVETWVSVREMLYDKRGRKRPWPLGSIVGEVTIVDCITHSDNDRDWFTGPYGFILADPESYEKPIPYRGRLGFFEVGLLDTKQEVL